MDRFVRGRKNGGVVEFAQQERRRGLPYPRFWILERHDSDWCENQRVGVSPCLSKSFRDVPYSRDITHGISWLMDLSRFIHVVVQPASMYSDVVITTTTVGHFNSSRYLNRGKLVRTYARIHGLTVTRCSHREMEEKTHFGHFEKESAIWKVMCVYGTIQKIKKLRWVLYLEERAFFRPGLFYMAPSQVTRFAKGKISWLMDENLNLATFWVRNQEEGRRTMYFWILEMYSNIWRANGVDKLDDTCKLMALGSVIID